MILAITLGILAVVAAVLVLLERRRRTRECPYCGSALERDEQKTVCRRCFYTDGAA